MPCVADAAECSESFLDFFFARLSAPSEHGPEELAAEHSENVWSSGGPDVSPRVSDSWADASALHSSLGLCSADEVGCCSSAVVSWLSLWVSMCSPSSEQLGGLGLSSARLLQLQADSVSCSATLRSGELFVGEGDGGGEESTAPKEGLGAESARSDSDGHEALATDAVGDAHVALEHMRRTGEEG